MHRRSPIAKWPQKNKPGTGSDQTITLAWSWIAAPLLEMEGLGMSYANTTYDHAQRAYIIPRQGRGPCELEFALVEDEDIGEFGAPMWIVNPAFVVKAWGKTPVALEIDGKPVAQGADFRVGYEGTNDGADLVLWLKLRSTKSIQLTIKEMRATVH